MASNFHLQEDDPFLQMIPGGFATAPEADEESGLFETVGAIAENDFIAVNAYKAVANTIRAPRDPEFNAQEPGVVSQYLTENPDIPPTERHALALSGARSARHLDIIGDRIRRELANEETISNFGNAGTRFAVRLGTNVFDPVNVIPTVGLTGRLSTASRGARMFQNASATAINAALLESVAISSSPTRGMEDALYSAGGGFLFGGALGAFGRTMSPEQRARIDDIQTRFDEAVRNRAGASSAGAAQTPEVLARTTEAFDTTQAAEETTSRATMLPGGFRIDSAGALLDSDTPGTRQLASWLLSDGAARRAGTAGDSPSANAIDANGTATPVTPFSAEEIKASIQRELSVPLEREYMAAFVDHAEATGLRLRGGIFGADGRQMEAFNQFETLVARAIRNDDIFADAPAAVQRAATAHRTYYRRFLEAAHARGLMKDIPPNARYLPRAYDREMIALMEARIGRDQMVRFFHDALKPSADEAGEVNGRLRWEVAQNLYRLITDNNEDDIFALAGMTMDDFRKAARDLLDKDLSVSDEGLVALADALHDYARQGNPQGTRAARRFELNETFSKLIDGEMISFDTFLVNRPFALAQAYANQVGGRIGLAEASGGAVRSDTDWRGFITESRKQIDARFKDAAQRGQVLDTDRDLRELATLESYYDVIVGRAPLHRVGQTTHDTLAAIREYGFTRLMGQVGFAQFSELGAEVGAYGIQALTRFVPALRRIFTQMKHGTLDRDSMIGLSAFGGFGGGFTHSRLRGLSGVNRAVAEEMDARGFGFETGVKPSILGPIRQFFQRTTHFVQTASGLQPLTDAMQDAAVDAGFRVLATRAREGKPLFPSARRQAAMGISDEMAPRVARVLKKVAEFDDNGNILGFHPSRTSDQEALRTLQLVLGRDARRLVQQGDLGNSRMWMSHPLTQTFLQFRSFVLTASVKQTTFQYSVRDWQSAAEMLWSTVAASLAWAAQRGLARAALSEEDREEFDQRVFGGEIGSPEFYRTLGLVGIRRSTWSTFLPDAVDLVSTSAGGPAFFASARSSGLSTDIKGLVPAAAHVGDAAQVFGNTITGDFHGAAEELSSLITPNLIGVSHAWDALFSRVWEDPEE